jgi:hypothetical protein
MDTMIKTQIVLPEDLSRRFKKLVPARKRSRFIAEALESRLRNLKLLADLPRIAGAWSDRNHPDLRSQEGINRYLSRFRGRLGKHGRVPS